MATADFTLPKLSDLARRQLRALRAGQTRRTSNFTVAGIPRSEVKPKQPITLRRSAPTMTTKGEEL